MVIIGIQHYKISLLAYFDAADTIRPVQGSSPVQVRAVIASSIVRCI